MTTKSIMSCDFPKLPSVAPAQAGAQCSLKAPPKNRRDAFGEGLDCRLRGNDEREAAMAVKLCRHRAPRKGGVALHGTVDDVVAKAFRHDDKEHNVMRPPEAPVRRSRAGGSPVFVKSPSQKPAGRLW